MVDIKNLRIGSHVLVGGVRGTVDGMDMPRPHWIPNNPLIRCKAVIDGEPRYCGGNLLSDEIKPIPITPDLLKELGFEWREDSSCWRKYQNYDGERYDWGIYAYAYGSDGGTWCFSLYLPNFLIKPQLYAEHLHEIEGQLAYYGVELIKE